MSHPKVIIITGVTRGLGRSLTERFIALGHTVFGCGRSAAAIEEMNQAQGLPHQFRAVDVAQAEEVDAWAADILAQGHQPDLLINNAAIINPPAPLWEVPVDTFSHLIDINIKGVFHSVRAFLPSMILRNAGVVINLSSGWGRSVSPRVAPYCASKYAIEGLSQALAAEIPPGMAVIPLNPGMIDTDMLRTCFGNSAAHQIKARDWAEQAADFILHLGPSENGQSLSVPTR